MEYTKAANGVSLLPQEAIDEILEIVRDTRDLPGAIVEAGAYKCGTTLEIAKADPAKKVYALDAFGGASSTFSETNFEGAKKYTESQSNISLVAGNIIDTARQVNEPVSILFIDCDDYAPAVAVLEAIPKKMPVGGKIIVDDAEFDGIVKAFAGWDSTGWSDKKLPSGLVVYTREA